MGNGLPDTKRRAPPSGYVVATNAAMASRPRECQLCLAGLVDEEKKGVAIGVKEREMHRV